MKNRSIQVFIPLLVFFIFFFSMAVVQFSTPDLPDNDGFYHIKLAWLMRTEGLKPVFSWLPLTILNPREFYDHHFLFHVALIPFTFGDLVTGAKWAAVTFSSLAFLTIWYLFSQQKIDHPLLWSVGLLAVSEAFIYRMSIPRAQSLSLGVLALGMAWMLSGKYIRLAQLAFFYVWLYDAFPLLMALAVLYVVAIAITEHRLELRPVIYVGIGLALGILVNPYFPYNLIFAYRHMLPKLVDATSIRVGNEWYPYTTEQLLNNSFPGLLAFFSGMFALGLSGRKMDLRTTFSLLVSLLFGLMLFQARRFVEYFPALVLIFATFAWSPFFQDNKPQTEIKNQVSPFTTHFWKELIQNLQSALTQEPGSTRPEIFRWLATVFIFIVMLTGSIFTITKAQSSIRDSSPFNMYAGASAWLEKNTPMGARVFQTDWDDFPRLFFYNTHNTYLIGLDPTYLQIADPDLFSLWEKITRGNVKNLSEIISGRFAAQYIHTDLKHTDFIKTAEQDPGLREVYRDEQAVIFEVIPK